jgi:predicted amidophosphoribosyltransferase
MSVKCEDNFGFYFTDYDKEELAFFCYIKSQSKPTLCARCINKVRLLEHVQICATCSQALEYGAPSDPAWTVPNLWTVGETY